MYSPASRQDTLAEHESVLVELDDGTRLIEIDENPDRYQNEYTYRIETPHGDPGTRDDERRAKLWISLYALVGGFSRPTSAAPAIPLPVVIEGKQAVATYLYAVLGWDSTDVADRLDVSRGTIWDYISGIRREADVFEQ